MTARAVWSGLAVVLTVSLGTALAPTIRTPSSAAVWLLSCFGALAIIAAVVMSWRCNTGMRSEWRSRSTAAIIGGISLAAAMCVFGLLWLLTGAWSAIAVGGAGGFVVVVVHCVIGPRRRWPAATSAAGTTLVVLAILLPVVAFAATGCELAAFHWEVLPALLIAAAPMVLAIHPELLAGRAQDTETRSDRLLALGMVTANVAGVIAIVALFPGSWELRLLGVSPAAVVSLVGVAALLHPSAATGRHLASLLSSVSYCAATAGLSLVFALS